MFFHHVQDTEPAAISGGDKREVGGPRLEGMLLPMAAYRPDDAPYPLSLSRQALLPQGQLLPLVDHGPAPLTTTGDGACEASSRWTLLRSSLWIIYSAVRLVRLKAESLTQSG